MKKNAQDVSNKTRKPKNLCTYFSYVYAETGAAHAQDFICIAPITTKKVQELHE
jgi:hypothetical protein